MTGSVRNDRLSFATAPALYAAVWFSAGILLTRYWILPGILSIAILLLALITMLSTQKAPRLSLLPTVCTWIALGLLLSEIRRGPDPQTQLSLLADSGAPITIDGVITRTTPVRLTESSSPFGRATRQEQSQSIDVKVTGPAAGGLRATVYGPADQPFPTLQCGDHLHAALTMHPPERYHDAAVWDATAWLRDQGIGVVGSLKSAALTRQPGPAGFFCWLHAMQQAGSQRLLAYASATPAWSKLDRNDAEILSAMILGDRTYLDHQTRVGFERTGSFHLLVVSGMHLAIFAGCIFGAARLLRIPRTVSTAITILSAFLYALLAGFGEPVQRSFWMVTLYLLAKLLFRERNNLNAIGFAALCLLAFDPRSLSGASFQMTLLSVLVVGGIAVPIAEHTFAPYLRASRNIGLLAIDPQLPPLLAQFRVTLRLISRHLQPLLGWRLARFLPPAICRLALRICELLLVSTLIELAMSLPMAIYFHRVTALGLPVNLAVLPLIGVALPSALVTFATLLLWPSAAFVPATVTAALLHSINAIVRFFSSLGAGDIRLPGPGAWTIAIGILLIGLAVWTARNSRFPVLLPVAALACSAACVFYPHPIDYRPGVMEITAIDVGQGDSILLITPEGKTLLIDAGGPTGGEQAPHGNFEIGEDVVSPYLWSRHIRRLDAIALTHAHSDHMGGMPSVIANFRPHELWVGSNPDIPAYRALLNEASVLGVKLHPLSAGNSFVFGSTQVDVLAPPAGYLPGAQASNDDSLVLHVAFRNTSALLEGDAQSASEQRMLPESLHADVLKIGHHGSKTSTTPRFFAAVSPRYAIISVAHHNPYGHPKLEVLDRLQDNHVHTFRTDALGATSFYLDGHAVTVQTGSVP